MRINRGGGVGKGEERRPETRKECREEGKGKRKEKKVRCFCVMIPLFCFTYIQQGFFLLETCFKHWWYFMGMIYTGKNSAARVFFLLFPENTFFSSLLLYLAHQGLPPRGKKARLLYVRSRKGSRFCLLPVLSSQFWRWKLGFAGPLTCMSKEKKERLRHAND